MKFAVINSDKIYKISNIEVVNNSSNEVKSKAKSCHGGNSLLSARLISGSAIPFG